MLSGFLALANAAVDVMFNLSAPCWQSEKWRQRPIGGINYATDEWWRKQAEAARRMHARDPMIEGTLGRRGGRSL